MRGCSDTKTPIFGIVETDGKEIVKVTNWVTKKTAKDLIDSYCDKFAARYNTRKIKDNERFEYYVERSEGCLKYAQLIGKQLPPSIFPQMMAE